MKRRNATYILFATLLASLSCWIGCDPNAAVLPDTNQSGQPTSQNSSGGTIADTRQPSGQLVSTRPSTSTPRITGVATRTLPVRVPQTVLIASFNIQVFGEKKVGDRWIAERLADVVRQFDVVAIQEVRAVDQTVMSQLLAYVNAKGARYNYILGPRLGRTTSKEQYAYIYDTDKIMAGPDASYTVNNDADLLHRTPLVARFVTRVPNGYPPFTFTLIDIHTDPDLVKTELPVLRTVMKSVREYEWEHAHEDDVMLLGDLNASPSMFGELGNIPGISWTVGNDQATNTRQDKTYDNIIFDRDLTNEFTGRSGVLNLCDMFGINTNDALRISDHFPVWAEFYAAEQAPGANLTIANDPSQRPVR